MGKFFTEEQLRMLCSTINWQHGENRMDALGASAIAARALEDVQSEAVEYLYPNLRARQLLPMAERPDEGATSVVWHEYDHDHMAEIIANYGDDLPEVALEAAEQSSPLKVLGAMYSYSTEDLRRVVFARANGRQVSLDVDKAMIAEGAIERKIEQIAIKGDTATGLPGLCRNANVTLLNAASPGTGSATEWDGGDKTPQEVFDDVVNLISTMYTQSKGVHRANIVAMPIAQYNHLKTTQFLTGTATPMTILEALQRQHPEVRFEEWPGLEEGAAGDAEVVVAMDSRPLNIEMVIPMESRPQPPQPHNLKFRVPVEAKTGGVIIKRPLAVVYMDGV